MDRATAWSLTRRHRSGVMVWWKGGGSSVRQWAGQVRRAARARRQWAQTKRTQRAASDLVRRMRRHRVAGHRWPIARRPRCKRRRTVGLSEPYRRRGRQKHPRPHAPGLARRSGRGGSLGVGRRTECRLPGHVDRSAVRAACLRCSCLPATVCGPRQIRPRPDRSTAPRSRSERRDHRRSQKHPRPDPAARPVARGSNPPPTCRKRLLN